MSNSFDFAFVEIKHEGGSKTIITMIKNSSIFTIIEDVDMFILDLNINFGLSKESYFTVDCEGKLSGKMKFVPFETFVEKSKDSKLQNLFNNNMKNRLTSLKMATTSVNVLAEELNNQLCEIICDRMNNPFDLVIAEIKINGEIYCSIITITKNGKIFTIEEDINIFVLDLKLNLELQNSIPIKYYIPEFPDKEIINGNINFIGLESFLEKKTSLSDDFAKFQNLINDKMKNPLKKILVPIEDIVFQIEGRDLCIEKCPLKL